MLVPVCIGGGMEAATPAPAVFFPRRALRSIFGFVFCSDIEGLVLVDLFGGAFAERALQPKTRPRTERTLATGFRLGKNENSRG